MDVVLDKNKVYIQCIQEICPMRTESMVERKILRCTDEGLQVLGESSEDAIYYHLEYDFKHGDDESYQSSLSEH